MKKNEVIIENAGQKLIYSENRQTAGARVKNAEGLFEYEQGESPYRKDYSLGKYTGKRAEPKVTMNFTGGMRHFFLVMNAARNPKNIAKHGTLPKEFAPLIDVCRLTGYVYNQPEICVQESKLDEFLKQVKELVIPDSWIEFVCGRSNTAKKELAPAKSVTPSKPKNDPAKSKPEAGLMAERYNENSKKITEMAEKLFTKYPTWSEIPANSISKVKANCDTLGVNIAEVRTAYNTLAVPEPEQTEQMDMEF